MANVKDGATGTVLTAPSPATSGTSLVLNSGEGARFPTAPFYVIAHPNNTLPTVSTSEKLLVTAISTDTLTITRAQGIYTAKSIAVGWRITNAIFQDDLNNASIIKNEVPGGSVNGSNTAFTVASATAMATGTLDVYKNGVRMKGGGADFTQTSTGFTMVTAPATGTVLLCDYIIAGALQNVGTNSLITDETPTGTVNGSNTSFTTARAYIAGSLEVYVNGLKQYRTTDITETTPSTGTFTFLTAPLTGDVVRVNYQYNLNPASNADTVDGVHANTTATANQLYPLGSDTKFPSSVLKGQTMRFQSDTTNSTQQNVEAQAGWGYLPGTGTNATTETVTLPTAFTTILSVHLTPLGVSSGSNPAAITDLTGEHGNDVVMFAASDITTSSFLVGLTAQNARNLAASTVRYGYSWIAYGIY